MRVFFIGTYQQNAGPDNVNRGIISISDARLVHQRRESKIGKLIEAYINLRKCDVVLISGVCSQKYFPLIEHSKKPVVYLMHGDLVYENVVNHENIKESVLKAQSKILEMSKAIIGVSKKYSEWIKDRYPQYIRKTTYVYNGLNFKVRNKKDKRPFSIAITGGNRPIKANKYVCEAAAILRKKGIDCEVYVFGSNYPNCDLLPEIEKIKYIGHVNKTEFYNFLDKISILIMNSDVESFGLSVADALNCNCSLLMSKNVGATSIFDIKDEDIIQDNHDPNEIAEKIQWIEGHPNADRLVKSLNLKDISERSSYERLMRICEKAAML